MVDRRGYRCSRASSLRRTSWAPSVFVPRGRSALKEGSAHLNDFIPERSIRNGVKVRHTTLRGRKAGARDALPPSLGIPRLLQSIEGRARPHGALERRWTRYGHCFTIYTVGKPPVVLISDPGDIRAIAAASAEQLHSGAGGALMEPVFGESAFMLLEKGEHSGVRDAIMPAFHNSVVQRQADLITDVVDHELASWPADTACSLSRYLHRLTLKVMLIAAIDDRQEHNSSACEPASHGIHEHEILCRRMLEMLSVMATPLLQEPQLRHLPGWRAAWRKFERRREAVDEVIYPLITSRRRACEHRDQGDRQADLLSLLVRARNADGSPFSDRQVRDNLVSVVIAGHETTAATLAWAFQLLAHNPAVQDRLIEEIHEGTNDTYMDAVIQEVLRHRPTFLFLPPRVVKEPIEISGWNYHPPAQLLACTYLLHHDPALYAAPQEFMPERFLTEAPRPGTFLPWGLGRKRCPGRQFALIEIRSVLRRALSTWQVLPARDRIERPRWRTVLLTPHAGSKVILRARGQRRHGPS
jgi:cytochrome P450